MPRHINDFGNASLKGQSTLKITENNSTKTLTKGGESFSRGSVFGRLRCRAATTGSGLRDHRKFHDLRSSETLLDPSRREESSLLRYVSACRYPTAPETPYRPPF